MTDESAGRGGLTRRQYMLLAAAGGVGAMGMARGLDQDGENGTLYGGKMALAEAFNVAGDLWVGPDSSKSTVTASSGRMYFASDTQLTYYGDGGSWVSLGVGTSGNKAPASHFQSLTTEDAILGAGSLFGHPRQPNHSFPPFLDNQPRQSSILLSGLEDTANWTLGQGGGSISNNTSEYVEGSQSIKISPGSASDHRIDYSLGSSVDLSDKHITFWAYTTDPTAIDRLVVYIKTNGFTDYYQSQVINTFTTGWNKISVSRSDVVVGNGTPSLSNINSISLQYRMNSLNDISFDGLKAVVDPGSGGYITIRLDDGGDATWDDMKPIVDKYNLRYQVAYEMDNFEDAGFMTAEQCRTIENQGNEVINHGSVDLTTLTLENTESQIYEGQKQLLNNGLRRGARFFVPQGYNMNNDIADIVYKYQISAPYYQSRTSYSNSRNHTNSLPLFEVPSQAGHYGHLITYNGGATSIADLKSAVDDAESGNGYLIVHWHPSSSITTKFDDFCSYVNDSTLTDITYTDIFDNRL